MHQRKYLIIACLLFLAYFINGIIAIPRLSITYDEGDNLSYGIRFVKKHPEKVKPFDDASTMPMLAFNALPRAIEQLQNPDLKKNDDGFSDIISGRYFTLFLSAFIGLFILRWSSELYGKAAGLFSLFLFVFCPNINANAVLVTTDALSCLFTVSTAYYFWKLMCRGSWKYVLLFSISIALAQLAKQSLTHLLIIFFFLSIIFIAKNKKLPKLNRDLLFKSLSFIFIFLLVINAGFLFHKSGQSLSNYHFRSAFFQRVQNSLSFAGSIPMPLPEPYITGLDLTKNMDEMGAGRPETSGNNYILGQSQTKGFWYYYFVSLFFKTPISVILLVFILAWMFWRKKTWNNNNDLIPVFCIGYFMIYFDFFYNSQVGIRHVIMIFPLLYVLLGGVANWLLSKKTIAAVFISYSIITFYVFFPNLYAYSNELLPNKKDVYRVLGNANIDYGQAYFLLQHYIAKHPEVKLAPDNPATGKFVLIAGEYLDINNTGKYKWLRQFEPIKEVEYCYLLFDISEDDIKNLK